jgi:hypothetical protein
MTTFIGAILQAVVEENAIGPELLNAGRHFLEGLRTHYIYRKASPALVLQ